MSSAYNPWADDEPDFDSDNPKVVAERNAKVANAMIIDARDNMFVKNAQGEVPFVNCLKACAHTLKNQIICEDTDFVGIYLAGAEKKSADSTFDNVYVFRELSAPTASLIREIDQTIRNLDEFRRKIGSIPANAKLPLAHAIWSVNLDLAKRKLKDTDTKSIWIFSNDDDPMKGDASLAKQCVQRANDGAEQGQEYVLWCMNAAPGVTFNPNKFYAQIIPVDDDEDEAIYNAGDGDFSKLLEHIRRKAFKKRVLGRFPLVLGGDIEMAVSMYARIMPLKIPTPLKLEAKTNAPLVCKTRWFCDATTTYLLPHQINYYVDYGGHNVPITKEEMKIIKDAGVGNGLSLVGFRPASALKDHHNLRTGYFLYPDETSIQGSTVAFSALHTKMLQLRQIGIGFLSVSKRAPKLVALVPQAEERDEEGFQVAPPGINVIPLPYADDLRNIPAPAVGDTDSDALTHAEAVVHKLQLPNFDSIDFENPKVQRHYAGVQALALLEDFDEEGYEAATADATLPDLEGMKKLAGDSIAKLAAAVGFDPNAAPPSRKRTASGKSTAAKKKPKKEKAQADAGGNLSVNDIEKLAASNGLKKLKVGELKAALKTLGEPVSGKKADLIERIENHFE